MTKTANFFELTVSENSPGGNAYAPDESYYEYYHKVKFMNELPFPLTLDNNIFEDYISNNLDWPLMSIRLKNIFDGHSQYAPPFKWVRCEIFSENNKHKDEYYLLTFVQKPDVLDYEKTKIIDNSYIYASFRYEKIKGFSFFPHSSEYNNNLVVAKALKDQILEEKITGVSFERAEIIY